MQLHSYVDAKVEYTIQKYEGKSWMTKGLLCFVFLHHREVSRVTRVLRRIHGAAPAFYERKYTQNTEGRSLLR